MDDIEAIRQLKARYFRMLDTKDWAAMRQVFADDAVMGTTASGGTVVTGADYIMAFLLGVIGDVITVHRLGEQPPVRRERVVDGGGERVLGGKPVADAERPRPRHLGEQRDHVPQRGYRGSGGAGEISPVS
jgi:hypothetical protein